MTIRRTTKLKQMLRSPEVEFLMEAHSGLSARIAEEAGFSGIWASGLSISAQLGVRDNNEASWTEMLSVIEFMADAASVPVLVDGDTGHGNFNNARRFAQKLETRGVAGVCIEDKEFPKRNSFIEGHRQPLATIDEFTGKIKAMKDGQADPDFCVVARTEALIAGWGVAEALKRAEAYRQAGADAVLIHSKKSTVAEIEAFMKEWGNRHPVVIVPTKYYSTPTEVFRELGVSLVIWANHLLRASLSAMQATAATIFKEQSLRRVEDQVAPLSEVFRLQREDELQAAEARYLPTYGRKVGAVILAAAQGDRDGLGDLVRDVPKTLLKLRGKTILRSQIDKLHRVGVMDVTVVRGFAKSAIRETDVSYVDNDEHADTYELYSLWLAREAIRGDTVICYGDLAFRTFVLSDLLNDPADIVLAADPHIDRPHDHRYELVTCDQPYSRSLMKQSVSLRAITADPKESSAHGEFAGIMRVSAAGAKALAEELEALSGAPDLKTMRMVDFIRLLLARHPVKVRYITGGWLDINTIRDLHRAEGF
jgi:phosphoenolpyruvate phosphomutase